MSDNDRTKTHLVLAEVAVERSRQDEKWGQQDHPDGTNGSEDKLFAELARIRCQNEAVKGTITWRDIMNEELGEAYAEIDPALLRVELIQVAAVAVAWVEAIDRRA